MAKTARGKEQVSIETLKSISTRLRDAADRLSKVVEGMEANDCDSLECEVKTLANYSQRCLRFTHNVEGDWLESSSE